jgi:hypothetical protein
MPFDGSCKIDSLLIVFVWGGVGCGVMVNFSFIKRKTNLPSLLERVYSDTAALLL